MKTKKNEKIAKYLDLARELKKETVEYEGDYDTNCCWWAWNGPQKLGKKSRNLSKNRNHPNHSIVKIGLNSEKSFRDLKRLAVTQSPEKNR